MRRFAELGYFPLMAAAAAAERHALASAASLQTFGAFALLFFGSAYAGWRGFSSPRLRGWSNGFWAAGVLSLALAPSLFDGLTVHTLDYLLTASVGERTIGLPTFLKSVYGPHGLNSEMLPAVFFIERGLFAAGCAAFFVVLAHDLGYRLREALEDFDLIEPDEDRLRRQFSPGAGQGGQSHQGRRRAERAETSAGQGAFGQRGAPPRAPAPMSEDARARMVLGVSPSATKRDIERAYRAQMKRAHPDHGGSVERAAALNAARDALLRRG